MLHSVQFIAMQSDFHSTAVKLSSDKDVSMFDIIFEFFTITSTAIRNKTHAWFSSNSSRVGGG